MGRLESQRTNTSNVIFYWARNGWLWKDKPCKVSIFRNKGLTVGLNLYLQMFYDGLFETRSNQGRHNGSRVDVNIMSLIKYTMALWHF